MILSKDQMDELFGINVDNKEAGSDGTTKFDLNNAHQGETVGIHDERDKTRVCDFKSQDDEFESQANLESRNDVSESQDDKFWLKKEMHESQNDGFKSEDDEFHQQNDEQSFKNYKVDFQDDEEEFQLDDMILTKDQMDALFTPNRKFSRNGVIDRDYLWPDKTVPVFISDDFSILINSNVAMLIILTFFVNR